MGPASATLILGGDAQTLSWSFVATDFPFLAASGSAQAKAISAATGNKDLFSATVLKVSHHASKHGVNLELVERIHPAVTLVSSTASGTKYGFPHTVSQEAIREALDPVASKLNPATGLPKDHKSDAELRIFLHQRYHHGTGRPRCWILRPIAARRASRALALRRCSQPIGRPQQCQAVDVKPDPR